MKTNLGLFLDFIKSREFVSTANVFEAIVAKNKIITVKKTHTQCFGFSSCSMEFMCYAWNFCMVS